MFGLGFWEIAIILAIALIVLGPSKLPELAKGPGKGLREFRKATEDFKSTIEDEMNKPELPPPARHAGQAEQIAEVIPAQGAVPHSGEAPVPPLVAASVEPQAPAAPAPTDPNAPKT